MGFSRFLPNTNSSRKQTLNKAQNKVTNSPVGGNILSPATTTRLADVTISYNNAAAAIITAIRAQRNAIKLAKPQRILLKDFCNSYVKSLDNGIKQGIFPVADRTFFGLDVDNIRLPKLTTDEELIDFSDLVISGDAERVEEGGVAMSLPTIAEFVAIQSVANPIIVAISNAKTTLTDKKVYLNSLNYDTDDCIVHVWNDVETNFSKYAPPAKRAACRPWSVRYISKGILSVVTGLITNSVTGLGIAYAKVRITGSGHSVLTDAMGYFTANTSMFGDLELTVTHPDYTDGGISFLKEDGVAFVQNLALDPE